MTDSHVTKRFMLAQSISDTFSKLPDVEAITLGGSVSTDNAGADSDIDLYVYVTREIPVATRAEIIHSRASYAEIDNRFWEPGDEWIEAESGIAVDLMYRHPAWIEDQLDRVLVQHEASTGYSTAFWHNVRQALPLFDRNGWFARLQERAAQPYPEELVRAIVARNHPLLRTNMSSFLHQLEKAVRRNDVVASNDRLTALLASYFDILFAANRTPHPGEKRLLTLASACENVPQGMVEHVRTLLQTTCSADYELLVRASTSLLDDLDRLLLAEGLLDPLRVS
ncbi:MAG TPA: nucleotidyltransferase domain-containing protein [Chloroflexia bacterium]|jgi:predicted nucleotidyltransferase